ncbi:MAG: ATP-binding protein [Lachnospiraceae bacterium]
MKKKINIQLVGIASIAIILTLLSVSAIFYDLFQKQVIEDLKTTARILSNETFVGAEEENVNLPNIENLRITLINRDGTVEYDSNASIGTMDNHSDREEVHEAIDVGEGYAIRRSDTLDKSAFYYAVRLEGGSVLRVAKETNSILSIFNSAIPVICILAALLFLLCMVLAHFLTIKLVKPIEDLANNLDGTKEIDTYNELKPFMNTIYKQHEDIMKSARMRQDFTANVSHELKTPLTSISGYSELIENGMATEEDTTRFAHEIHKNATRLLTLINDIIRLSELDVTDVSNAFEKVNLYQIAETCVDMLQLNAENHKVSLTFWGEPCEVMATKEMMEELLYNLCDNAIRYNNENGTVHVSVKHIEDTVVLTVKDTGIGIPKEHQERIFERFYRVDKSRSKSTGGTGLGLAIVKHIVAQCNAKMELRSEVLKGTEIKIIFPRIQG